MNFVDEKKDEKIYLQNLQNSITVQKKREVNSHAIYSMENGEKIHQF